MEMGFELCSQLRVIYPLFVYWYCVDIFGIPPARHREILVKVPDWWEFYEGSCLLYAPTSIVFLHTIRILSYLGAIIIHF